MLALIDIHAVLDHLYLDGTQPKITAPAEDYLRESASPYTLPALIGALAEVINLLGRAIRDASPDPHPVSGDAHREHRNIAHQQRMRDSAEDAGI